MSDGRKLGTPCTNFHVYIFFYFLAVSGHFQVFFQLPTLTPEFRLSGRPSSCSSPDNRDITVCRKRQSHRYASMPQGIAGMAYLRTLKPNTICDTNDRNFVASSFNELLNRLSKNCTIIEGPSPNDKYFQANGNIDQGNSVS